MLFQGYNFDNFSSLYFQYDGALPYYITIVQNCVDEVFQWRVIGRRGAIEIPPRSPDLTPMDFFLWVYVKDKVYAAMLQTTGNQRIKRIYVFEQIYFNKWMLNSAGSYDKIYQRIKWKAIWETIVQITL